MKRPIFKTTEIETRLDSLGDTTMAATSASSSSSSSSSLSSPTTVPPSEHVGQLSPFVCACFTLNYIIGTGFLTLPWAFEVGGIFLSCLAMALTCFISALAGDYILNAMARADALAVVNDNNNLIRIAASGNNTSESNPLLATSDSGGKVYQATTKTLEQQQESTSSTFHAFAVEFDSEVITHGKTNVWSEAYQTTVKEHGRLLVSNRKFELTELVR